MIKQHPRNTKRNKERYARLEIVSKLYKRGYSERSIMNEVNALLNTNYCSATIHNDIQMLLKEWRETRIESIDDTIQLELERIDCAVIELWEQWEKSKQDYTKTENKRKGAPMLKKGESAETKIKTIEKVVSETTVIKFGDVSYIAEIRQQLVERRKLLGLYAPEKKEISGGLTNIAVNVTDSETAEKFSDFLAKD
ncbi:hypothetical protein FACS189434_09320 [Bacteroidia bacterium]|nr:hypothetical protein FACS189434_09320 [Bacteroidia bacterium]